MSTTGAPAQSGEQRPQPGEQRPLRADAQRNYQRLVTAASAAFAEHGADDASLEEIARRAGVGIGTLYRHFPNRQALLEAVYRDQVDVLSDRARQLSESENPGAALEEWLRALVSFGRTKRSLTSAMLATLDKDSELLSTCSLIMRSAATTLLKRAQEAGVVRADATPPTCSGWCTRSAWRWNANRPTRARPTGCSGSSWMACAISRPDRADPPAVSQGLWLQRR